MVLIPQKSKVFWGYYEAFNYLNSVFESQIKRIYRFSQILELIPNTWYLIPISNHSVGVPCL